MFGDAKFSVLHNNNVAAANNPTTTGRMPLNIDCTELVFIYFINILVIRIIRINDGNTNAKVAVKLPNIGIIPLKPAFCTAVYPQYVAELIPIGPGVICEMATIFVNSADDSQ